MTEQDEIIKMAKQVGGLVVKDYVELTYKELEAFAKLVASAASAKEREACAKVCEYESGDGPDNGCCPTYWNEAQEACAKAIRARGQQ